MLETIEDFNKYKPAVRANPSNGNVEYRDSRSFGCDALSAAALALYESACSLGKLTRPENVRVTCGNINE